MARISLSLSLYNIIKGENNKTEAPYLKFSTLESSCSSSIVVYNNMMS